MTDKPDTTALEPVKPSGPPMGAVIGKLGMELQTLEEMWWLANRVANSNMVPEGCKGPDDVFVRAQCGMQAGLSFMQAIQYVANVKGHPTIWGPPLKGIALASGMCEKWDERYEGEEKSADFAAVITVKRHDLPNEQEFRFSKADAKQAGLMGNNTYIHYLRDMLMNRATSRAVKRMFPDYLGGLVPAQDERDIIHVEPISVTDTPSKKPRSMADVADAVDPPEPVPEPKPKAKPKARAKTPEPEPDKAADVFLERIAGLVEISGMGNDTLDSIVAGVCDGECDLSMIAPEQL
ncbi:MAG: hypothetical protein U9Q07_01775, partial [Planctomycetota bacterium]|nr:hypothetical protein [Planctomycetota bacterium]